MRNGRADSNDRTSASVTGTPVHRETESAKNIGTSSGMSTFDRNLHAIG
ncbi:hypothetical protein [Alloactinosynnema sp. L-07]|nr:hypothetical protein [Alloactinosynnema sp. L-07]